MTLQEATRVFAAEPRLLFCSDFDGTLTPIAPTPEKADLSGSTRRSLWSLTRTPGISVAIVSGRGLLDLRRKVALPGLWYVGNHGLEIMGPDTSYVHPDLDGLRPMLGAWLVQVRQRLTPIPGIVLEDKQFTASVHYRLVNPEQRRPIENILRSTCPPTFEVRGGKMVWELRPKLDWHKGWGITWLAQQLQAPIVFLGDDVTDEDAFETLCGRALTIKVGSGPTAARFRLRDVEAVLGWIESFLKFRREQIRLPVTAAISGRS